MFAHHSFAMLPTKALKNILAWHSQILERENEMMFYIQSSIYKLLIDRLASNIVRASAI